jgi:peroxiredoxin Q/BCP
MSKLLWVSVLCAGLSAALAAQAQQPPAGGSVGLKEGDKAPEFSLPGTDGKTHTLSGYKGRAVVLAWFPAAMTGG